MDSDNSVDFSAILSFKQLQVFKPELLSQQVSSSKNFTDESSYAPHTSRLMLNPS